MTDWTTYDGCETCGAKAGKPCTVGQYHHPSPHASTRPATQPHARRATRRLTRGTGGVKVPVMQAKSFKQQVAETHYLPGRSLQDDVLDARRLGHSWRKIADKVNDYLASDPNGNVRVTHESLRQWYGEVSV